MKQTHRANSDKLDEIKMTIHFPKWWADEFLDYNTFQEDG